MKKIKLTKEKKALIKKINEIGISNFWVEQAFDCGSLGSITCFQLNNGEEVFFTQWFSFKPLPEGPYVEVFKDGNSDPAQYFEIK